MHTGVARLEGDFGLRRKRSTDGVSQPASQPLLKKPLCAATAGDPAIIILTGLAMKEAAVQGSDDTVMMNFSNCLHDIKTQLRKNAIITEHKARQPTFPVHAAIRFFSQYNY